MTSPLLKRVAKYLNIILCSKSILKKTENYLQNIWKPNSNPICSYYKTIFFKVFYLPLKNSSSFSKFYSENFDI